MLKLQFKDYLFFSFDFLALFISKMKTSIAILIFFNLINFNFGKITTPISTSFILVDKIACFKKNRKNNEMMCDIKKEKGYQILSNNLRMYEVKSLNGVEKIEKYKLSPCVIFCKISRAIKWVEQNLYDKNHQRIVSIIVNSGIYSEIIHINTPLILRSSRTNLKKNNKKHSKINLPILNGIDSECVIYINSNWVEVNGFKITGKNLYGICIKNNINNLRVLKNNFEDIVISPINAPMVNKNRESWYFIENIFSNWINQNVFAIRVSNINNFHFEKNVIKGLGDMNYVNGLYAHCITNATFINNTIENLTNEAIRIVNDHRCSNHHFHISIKENVFKNTKMAAKISLNNLFKKKSVIQISNNVIKNSNEHINLMKDKESIKKNTYIKSTLKGDKNFIIETTSLININLKITNNDANYFYIENTSPDYSLEKNVGMILKEPKGDIIISNNVFNYLSIHHECGKFYAQNVMTYIIKNTIKEFELKYTNKKRNLNSGLCYYPKTYVIKNNIKYLYVEKNSTSNDVKTQIINNEEKPNFKNLITRRKNNNKKSKEIKPLDVKLEVMPIKIQINNINSEDFNIFLDIYCNYGIINMINESGIVSDVEFNITQVQLQNNTIYNNSVDYSKLNDSSHCLIAKKMYYTLNCLSLNNCSRNGNCVHINGSYFNGSYVCNCNFPFEGTICNITSISYSSEILDKFFILIILVFIGILIGFILIEFTPINRLTINYLDAKQE